jgi:hypothetical protein
VPIGHVHNCNQLVHPPLGNFSVSLFELLPATAADEAYGEPGLG